MSSLGLLRAFAIRVVVALVLCAALVATGVAAVNRYIDDEVAKIPRIDVTVAPIGDHGVNYVIVGSDSRQFVESDTDQSAFGTLNKTGPPRSDTLMVLHVDGDRSYAVSFPRDLWVKIPGKADSKINAAYNDGPQRVIDTLKANFDIDTNHYLEINFHAFEALVNAIGTVGVYFPAPTRDHDPTNQGDTGFSSPGGCDQLDGVRALQYVRARHMEQQDPFTGKWSSIDPIPDIARIDRQQSFVKKLGTVSVRRLLADPMLAPDVVDGVVPELTADREFDRAALNQLVANLVAMSRNGEALQFQTLPWAGGPKQQGQEVLYVKHPEADTVLDRLRGNEPIPTAESAVTAPAPSSTPAVRPVDVRVKVLNGSGVQGAAAKAQASLAQIGFVNGDIGNDSRGTVPKSEVRYKPGQEAKAQLVAAHVPGVVLVADAALPGTDVVLVLGKDVKTVTNATSAPAATTAPAPAVTPEAACE